MTSKAFLVSQLVLAVCGLAVLTTRVALWSGSVVNVVALVAAVAMFAAGATNVVLALRLRRRARAASPS